MAPVQSGPARFGVWDVDSVTEIFVPSTRAFEEATADDPIRDL